MRGLALQCMFLPSPETWGSLTGLGRSITIKLGAFMASKSLALTCSESTCNSLTSFVYLFRCLRCLSSSLLSPSLSLYLCSCCWFCSTNSNQTHPRSLMMGTEAKVGAQEQRKFPMLVENGLHHRNLQALSMTMNFSNTIAPSQFS